MAGDNTKKKNIIKLGVMCSFTFLFFLAEIIVGYFTKSLALVADSFHMLSDLIALIIAIAAIKVNIIYYLWDLIPSHIVELI